MVEKKNFSNWLLLGFLGLGICWTGCGKKEVAAAKDLVLPVNAVEVLPQDIYTYVDALGGCTAFSSVDMAPQVTGELLSMGFKEGRLVKKGDLLYTIEPRPYKAEFERLKAVLAQDEAQLKLNELKLQRSLSLLQGHFISQQEADTDAANVAMSKAAIEADKANIEKASVDLEHCTIVAPIDGLAGLSQLDVGNVITGSWGAKPLVTLRAVNPLYVDASIPEADFLRLQAAWNDTPLAAEVTLLASKEVKRSAKVNFRDNAVSDSTGMVAVRAELKNDDLAFWPGQAVRIRLLLTQVKQAPMAPYAAVQVGQVGTYVYVIKADQSVDMRPIVLGQRYGDLVHIIKGVGVGEQVVTTKQMMLHPGAKVVVIPAGGVPGMSTQGSEKK